MDQWLSYQDPFILRMERRMRPALDWEGMVTRPMFEVRGDLSNVSVYQFSEFFYDDPLHEVNDLMKSSTEFADEVASEMTDRADIIVE